MQNDMRKYTKNAIETIQAITNFAKFVKEYE